MKLTVTLLLLAVTSQAAEVTSRRQRTKDDSKTDKRALVEGNAGVEKRAPVIATALPSVTPGIEYADTKEFQSEKSPQQQIYATAVPQLAKISDLLTGQGPPFQAAIASHLFSPVSLYQTRLASPTYEVSAPVPSQLAYTEKITYQPQTPEQFTPQVYKHAQKQQNFARLAFQPLPPVQQYQQLQPQHFSQYQPQLQQVQPQVFQIPYQPQLVYNSQPIQYQNPIQYTQQPITFVQRQPPQLAPQPGIIYAQQETDANERPSQRELKATQVQATVQEKPEQNYNAQPQGPVSFASFSVGPATVQHGQPQSQPEYQPQPQSQSQQQIQPQYQYQQHQQYQQPRAQPQAQPQFQLQPQPSQHYQPQPSQPQVQSQHQYPIQRLPLPQPNPQYQSYNPQDQIQPQILQKLEPSLANSVAVPSKPLPVNPGKHVAFLRQDQPYQPQFYQNQDPVFQNQFGIQSLPVPTFPPVQFFGKYAQTLFKNYQQ